METTINLRIKKVLTLTLIIMMVSSCTPKKGKVQVNEKWQPSLESISAHEAPEWLKDAKIGIQFVGPPQDFNDLYSRLWIKDVQMRRELGYKEPNDDEFDTLEFYSTGQLRLDYVMKDEEDEERYDYDKLMESYKQTGARFLKSTLLGCYPGTEGLLMLEDEVSAARRHGFKIGIHYNLLGTGKIPAIGHPGYVEWSLNKLKNEINRINADFLFFDGASEPASFHKTPELVAWFYNNADIKGKDVWVNDDLGSDCSEKWEYGDVFEMEGTIMSSVSPKTWMKWDNITNQWDCWVNEFGIGVRNGTKWEWVYREPEDMLHIFIDIVSKGGIWLVQMVNTKQAWENMWEIGDWLGINGEAIYNTRPFFEADTACYRVPQGPLPEEARKMNRDERYWWRYQQTIDIATKHGPYYYTSKNDVVYVIHWGWPGDEIFIPGIHAKESSSIRMLGVEKDLIWQQEGGNLIVQTPDVKPCKYAYCFKIHLASNK